MTELAQSIESAFPKRLHNHQGTWIPLYLETIPGSGERICIGVAAVDSASSVVVPVDRLDRFGCVYGQAASSLAWSAELAIAEAQAVIDRGGLAALSQLERTIDGFILGPQRLGAGTGLTDLARLGLQQVSALYSLAVPTMPFEEGAAESQHSVPRLESEVRRFVVERRPELKELFGRTFRPSQTSRPLRYGFVGRFTAANFAILNTRSPSQISVQVDRAKARLWDLQQLDEGILADSLALHPESMSYELLVHRLAESLTPTQMVRKIRAAEEELEAEADKFDIRFRLMNSPAQIAQYLVQREAA
jgi:hypothetical protein